MPPLVQQTLQGQQVQIDQKLHPKLNPLLSASIRVHLRLKILTTEAQSKKKKRAAPFRELCVIRG